MASVEQDGDRERAVGVVGDVDGAADLLGVLRAAFLADHLDPVLVVDARDRQRPGRRRIRDGGLRRGREDEQEQRESGKRRTR